MKIMSYLIFTQIHHNLIIGSAGSTIEAIIETASTKGVYLKKIRREPVGSQS